MSQIVTSNCEFEVPNWHFKNRGEQMGLAACPRASFAVGRIGVGVEGSFADLLRKCAWNGVGGVSASGVSACIVIIDPVGIGLNPYRQNQRKVGLRHAG